MSMPARGLRRGRSMHTGELLAPIELVRAWSLEPTVVAGLAAGAMVYGLGARRLWAATGAGRGISRRRAVAFGLGILSVAVALLSPLDALSDVLFSAHMVQHLVLILVAPVLLLAGRPLTAALWALRPAPRARLVGWWRQSAVRPVWATGSAPAAALALHAAVVLAWHAPPLFDAALRHESIHALEHASFLATALLFWWPVLHPGARRGLGHGGAVLYVSVMFVLGGVLGALITFAPRVLYDYGPGVAAWGLTPLEDQQLAGLIMWVPGGTLYLAAAAWVAMEWFRLDRRGPGAMAGRVAPEPATRRS